MQTCHLPFDISAGVIQHFLSNLPQLSSQVFAGYIHHRARGSRIRLHHCTFHYNKPELKKIKTMQTECSDEQ